MGALIEWNDGLSVGIQEIDEQHKVLVELVNELNQAMKERHGNDVVSDILARLDEYTRIHFAVEESLMRMLGYPAFEEHKGEHEALIDDLSGLRERFASGQQALSFELMHFLRMWLTNHIQETDMEYSRFFLDRGVKAKWEKKSGGLLGRFWGRH